MLAKKNRDSNFELLRIIAMILIVANHLGHSGVEAVTPFYNFAVYKFLTFAGKLAVNVFVFISGYFLVKSKFKPEKVFALWAQTFTYSSVIYLIFVSAGLAAFSWKDVIFSFLPFSTNAYWFMTCYIVMYLASPLVNLVLKHITRAQHIGIMAVLFFICSIVPTFSIEILSSSAWFIFVYLCSAYISFYPKAFEKRLPYFIVFVVTFTAMALLRIFADISVYNLTSPVCFLCALSLFVVFKNTKVKHSPVVNKLKRDARGISCSRTRARQVFHLAPTVRRTGDF